MASPAVGSSAPPTVSVVLPVRNEGAHIEAVLGDLLGQALGPVTLEVLVVDGGSTDDTRQRVQAAAQRDPRVRLLDNPLRLSSAARVIGAREARGAYVAYVDGHCRLPSRTLLLDMVGLFERTGADCLARPQPLLGAARGWVAQAVAAARTSRFGHSTASTIYDDREHAVSPVSAGAMYRRQVFDRVGTFDPAFDACEDVEFNWRVQAAGLTCFTSPRLAVSYVPRSSLRGLLRQMLRYGWGRARFHRKHPTAFQLESLVPVLFVLGLAALVVAPLLPAPWGLVVAAPYALYAALSLGAALLSAGRFGWDLLPLLPLVFLLIHVGLGLGYLLGRLERWPKPSLAGAP